MSPIGNIKRAVTVLGNRQVRTLSLAFSLVPLQNALLDFTHFWEHSLATAVGARQLLRRFGSRQVEDGFTAGLLANIGAILLAGAQPVKYQKVLKRCGHPAVTAKEVEKEVFGFDHTALGSVVARRWRFPENLLAVIDHHHDPREVEEGGEIPRFVQAVHLAGIVADLFHADRPDLVKSRFQYAIQQMPAWNGLAFDDLARGVEEETQEVSTWMGIHLPVKRSIAEILEEANKRLVAIGAEYEKVIEWIYRTQVDLIRMPKD